MTTFNIISLQDTYAQFAQYFLYRGQSSILFKSEFLRLARLYAKRSEKIGKHFDNGCVSDQKTYEALSNDLERMFYTLNDLDSSNPLLMTIDRIAELMDELAIEAFIRDRNEAESRH